MSTRTTTYQPHGEQRAILAHAWGHVQSVPYVVTARWLFYRLLQDGTYGTKEAYKGQFLPLLSRARKAFYGPWRPDSLADESRECYLGGDGFDSEAAWRKAVRETLSCDLDHWAAQPRYIELWFEAKAMRAQFEYHAPGFTLRPFGGDPSIDYKWKAARHLEAKARRYGKPVAVYYFGDRDDKGEQIEFAALADIRAWCSAPFTYARVGLTIDQARAFRLPSSIDKPDAYQWEALTDPQAARLIESVSGLIDASAWEAVDVAAAEATERLRRQLETLDGAA